MKCARLIAIIVAATPLWLCVGVSDGRAEAGPQTEIITDQVVAESFVAEDPTKTSDVAVSNGEHETLNVPVISWRDLPFQTVKRQALDYSCGSAAVATLLTYIYDTQTPEESVFKAMFEAGDQAKIRQKGFSLLDISRYLNKRGFKAAGYKIGFDSVEKKKVPFIALVNNDGYNHFVIVKSLMGPYVLVGDPSRGNVIYRRDDFSKKWNGIALVVTNHAQQARASFNNQKDWKYAHPLALPYEGEYPGLDSVGIPSTNWQVAPFNWDIMTPVNNAILQARTSATNF
jgi:hypothetical protein